MVLGDKDKRIAKVKWLAGNIANVAVSDEQITESIDTNDNRIMLATDKFDWVDTDKQFIQVLSAANLFASAQILDGIPNAEPAKIESQRREARDILKTIIRKDPDQIRGAMASAGPRVREGLDPDNYMNV